MSESALSLLSRSALEAAPALAQEFSAGKPFRHVLIDGLLEPAFCEALIAEFPKYEDARFRNSYGDRGKAHHEDVRALGPAFARLDELARSPEFLRWLSAVSGVEDLLYDPEYVGGGTHESLQGMHIEPHVDFNVHPTTGFHRRLNVLLYLTDWPAEWGGMLGLHSDPVAGGRRDQVKRFELKRNRCVVFETSDRSWHSVSPVTLPPWRRAGSRRSFALYYYTRTRQDGARHVPSDLTMFLDPPVRRELLRPGRFLTPADARELSRALNLRDRKIRYLYDRALWWYQAKRDADAAERLRKEKLRVALESLDKPPSPAQEPS